MGKPNLKKAIEHINAMTICDEGQKAHIRAALAELAGEELPKKLGAKVEAGAMVSWGNSRNSYLVMARYGRKVALYLKGAELDSAGCAGDCKVITPATVEVGDTVQSERGRVGLVYYISSCYDWVSVQTPTNNGTTFSEDWARDKFTILLKAPKQENSNA